MGYISFWIMADDLNLLGHNIEIIKRNTETLIVASRGVCLEVNLEKTKYILVSRYQNADQNRYIKIANRSEFDLGGN
jgi:hypothetical protein